MATAFQEYAQNTLCAACSANSRRTRYIYFRARRPDDAQELSRADRAPRR